MWTFKQSTGAMSDVQGVLEIGWAGQREGRNNPAMQSVHNEGPLPQGTYTIGEPHDSPHTGPYTMDLTPSLSNNMFGRSEFRIHGAALHDPDLSSDGCIIIPRPAREKIWESGDHELEVIS
jgi:hypothetical protein